MLATAAVTAAALFAPTEVITFGGVNMEPTLKKGQRIEDNSCPAAFPESQCPIDMRIAG